MGRTRSKVHLIVLVITAVCFTAEGMKFTCSPVDAFAVAESSARFCCSYIGTSDLPFLRINSTIYRPTNLPPNHYYTRNGGLLVYNVGRSMNGTTYSCVHVDYDADTGKQLFIESCKATLIVGESATEGSDPECCSEDIKCEDTASSQAQTSVAVDGSQGAPVLSSTSALLIFLLHSMTVV